VPLIEWTEALSVGFPEIDKDHQKLIEIANRFNDAIAQDSNREELKDIFEELIEYTNWHFRHEERLMLEYGYEKMEEHQQIHRKLATSAVENQRKYDNGDDSVLNALMPFLKDWLTQHILVIDKDLAAFLVEQE